MKKLIVLMILLALLTGCQTTGSADAAKFKEEYEAENGQDNGNGKTYTTMTIAADNPIVYATGADVLTTLTEGSGIILFGFPQCPWCRLIIPVLLEMAAENNVDKILYYNNKDQRDTKTLDASGQIVTEQTGTDEYYQILTALGDYASVYAGLNDDSVKRLYFPTVVFVSAGTIVGLHVSAVDSVTDPYQPLTDQQHDELLAVYQNLYQDYTDAAKGCKYGSAC